MEILALAGAALLFGVLAVPYSLRATIGVALGAIPLAMGTRSLGPLASLHLAQNAPQSLAIFALVGILPGALFFRARYRALSAARVLLGLALVLSAPALVWLS